MSHCTEGQERTRHCNELRSICSSRPLRVATQPDHPSNQLKSIAEHERAASHQALGLRPDRPGLLPLVRLVRLQRAVAGEGRAQPRGAAEPRRLLRRLPPEAQGRQVAYRPAAASLGCKYLCGGMKGF